MRVQHSGILLGSLALGGTAAAWNHVSESQLQQALKSEYTLAAFVDSSHDLSQTLEQEWVSIQEIEGDNNVVSFDCSTGTKLCDEHDIASYPAIRLFHDDGRIDRYRGPRKASSIVPFLRRLLRPAVSQLDNQNITSFLSVDDVIFVANLKSGDSAMGKRFTALAHRYRDRFSFGIGPTAAQSTVSCFNTLDDQQRSITELAAVDSLAEFVKLCSSPLIVELTRGNEMEYLNVRYQDSPYGLAFSAPSEYTLSQSQMGKSLVHYFAKDDKQRQSYLKDIRPLAKKYSEYLVFTTIDADEYPDMLQSLGWGSGSGNVISVHNPGNGDVYPYRGAQELSLPVVENFLTEIIQGNVQPWGGPGTESGSESKPASHEEL